MFSVHVTKQNYDVGVMTVTGYEHRSLERSRNQVSQLGGGAARIQPEGLVLESVFLAATLWPTVPRTAVYISLFEWKYFEKNNPTANPCYPGAASGVVS